MQRTLPFSSSAVTALLLALLPGGSQARAQEFPQALQTLDGNPLAKAIAGQRYTAMAPDTLDLAERMGLAVNAMTNVWSPEHKWAMYFNADLLSGTGVLSNLRMYDSYLNIPPKFVEALTLCRLASGSDQNLATDREVLRAQLSFLGPDGLTYSPKDMLPELGDEWRDHAEVWAEGRWLIALSMLAQVDDDPRWVEIGKHKIDRLLSLTREKEGFRFLWKTGYRPGDAPPPEADEQGTGIVHPGLGDSNPTFRLIYSVGALGHGSGLFYRVTGYPPALELSRGLAQWALTRMFKYDDGHYEFGTFHPHFHHGLYALMAVCEYGVAADDRKVLERVDACYRWARGIGDPVVGFYPEWMTYDYKTVEICEVADLVWLALYLTRAGIGDYWDDVDRWVRNMYAEGQYRDVAMLGSASQGAPANPAGQPTVQERMVGAFFGWLTPNSAGTCHIMHCCTANGARTLYPVWDSIVKPDGDLVRVNLLLNRASPWLDVDSYLPVEGKVVLRIKEARHVAVRMPEWCVPFEVSVTVDQQARRPQVRDRYVYVRDLQPGNQVTLTFPVSERVLERVMAGETYRVRLRGANVVGIEPGAARYPLYARQPTGKLIEHQRFVPQRTSITW
jgi:hypothetical protein